MLPPEGGVIDGAMKGERLAQERYVKFHIHRKQELEPRTMGLKPECAITTPQVHLHEICH